MVTYGSIGEMGEFANNIAASPDDFARVHNNSSSGSPRRSGVGSYDNFFGDHAVCPTCRGVGHIPHGLILSVL